jgi:hypothetical protein
VHAIEDIEVAKVPRQTGASKSSHPGRWAYIGTLLYRLIDQIGLQRQLVPEMPWCHDLWVSMSTVDLAFKIGQLPRPCYYVGQ